MQCQSDRENAAGRALWQPSFSDNSRCSVLPKARASLFQEMTTASRCACTHRKNISGPDKRCRLRHVKCCFI